MVDKNNNEVSVYPRLYTLHSQKGGVGKTSIALAIAGIENILNNKKVVIIDADMTGASLIDIYPEEQNENIEYFNDLLLAGPNDFADYTPICSRSDKTSPKADKNVLQSFRQNLEINKLSVDYIPASPLLKDILKVVPLISQEDHLHFFRHRLEDIITTLWTYFEVIIIDNPPGLYGISKASLDIVIDETKSTPSTPTRLDKIHFGQNSSSDNKAINMKSTIISTPDPHDYRAILPSFSWYLLKKKDLDPEKISKNLNKLSILINKANPHKHGARIDPAFILEQIFTNIQSFSDGRDFHKKIHEYFYDKAKNTGAFACMHVNNFRMRDILQTISTLNTDTPKVGPIQEWCTQIDESIDITHKA